MPSCIEEYRADNTPFSLDDIVTRGLPVVIRGLASDWPIVKTAAGSVGAFARELIRFDNGAPVDTLIMPPEVDGKIGYNDNFDGFNYTAYRVSITQGLNRLAEYSRQSPSPGLAMQNAVIANSLPGFLQECTLPFLGAGLEPHIWLGNKVTTPAHFDQLYNIAVVIAGGRRFTLFPPDQLPNLYIGPLDFSPTGTAISIARLDRPDDPRFPRLKLALAAAQSSELHPGDAIYIPPMWWHNVESLDRLNGMINYWWKAAPANGLVPGMGLGGLLHCLLAYKSLPAVERAAWKGLLDYYVFGDEQPWTHIPPERRGVLGALDAEQVTKLRETIQRYLR